MKRIVYLSVLLIIASCSSDNEQYTAPKEIVISGRVLNHDKDHRKINFYIDKPGFSQEELSSQLDSLGNFSVTWESYLPTDLWVTYQTDFLILARPGDSIFMEFDGLPRDRLKVLESATFFGDASQANRVAVRFQEHLFSYWLSKDPKPRNIAIQDYEPEEFVSSYLDPLKDEIDSVFTAFENEVSPDDMVKVWAKTLIELEYYDALMEYPVGHSNGNNLKVKIPKSYFDPLFERFPLTKDGLISSSAIASFAKSYQAGYVIKRIQMEESYKNLVLEQSDDYRENYDSLLIQGFIKHTPDPLLKQILLAGHFWTAGYAHFNKYREVVEDHINEPFLIEPLMERFDVKKAASQAK